jgi:hypothetical protein
MSMHGPLLQKPEFESQPNGQAVSICMATQLPEPGWQLLVKLRELSTPDITTHCEAKGMQTLVLLTQAPFSLQASSVHGLLSVQNVPASESG